MQFASTLSQMDPEVAKKALEQFPEFAKTIKAVISEQNETITHAINSGNESMKETARAYQQVLNALQKELDREDLSAEERKDILDRMVEVADKFADKDSEHKAFLLKLAGIGGSVAVAAIGIAAAVIGGNVNIQNITDGLKNANK